MRIAITGIGVATAIGTKPDEVLHAIKNKTHGLAPVSLFETKHRLPVAEVKLTNAQLYKKLGIANKTLSRTAILGILAASHALRDAQLDDVGNLKIGVISSTSTGGMDLTENFYHQFMTDNRKGRLRHVVSHDCADSTLRIADYCNIRHFSTTISTACSSAANAIISGARLIENGFLDYALVGGTDALCKFTLNGFSALMILDKNPCRPFDASRAGLNLGEGAGFLLLQPEKNLHRAPYCYLSGYANANDAFHQTATSANGEGAFLSMGKALTKSKLQPNEIDYINIHGTGTQNNDTSEGAALSRIFGEKIPAFSSTKPFTGHTLAAAGGIEAVLSVLSVHKGVVFPNLNFQNPMENTTLIPETEFMENMDIRHVMSNSFGFGGNSSTLIFSK